MSNMSQDNYVMEMQVQQEEWAKQKETHGEEWSGLGGLKKIQIKGQNNINIHPFIHSVVNVDFKRVCEECEKQMQLSKIKAVQFRVNSPTSYCQTSHGVG